MHGRFDDISFNEDAWRWWKKPEKNKQQSWSGVKSFFYHKLEMVKVKVTKLKDESTDVEKLEAAVIEEVIDAVNRQLDAVSSL